MAHRDEYSDTSRTGPGKSREDCMVEVDFRVGNLTDEAKRDRAAGLPTVGTRGYSDTEAFEKS